MGGSRASLDGKPLLGAVSWAQTSGVRPFQAVVYVRQDDAKALLGEGGTAGTSKPNPVTLKLSGGLPERSGEFRHVYVLHRVPAPVPKYAALLISDRRWLWSRTVYRRHMNVRRKAGTKRLTSPDQLDPTNLEPALVYASWSLRNRTTPWTAKSLIDDLADAVESWERAEVGASAPPAVRPALDDTGQLPIQDLELDGPLDECIERALSYLPGMDVTIDPDGSARFFQRADGSERAEIDKASPETQTGGHIEDVKFARTRPRKVRVWFNVEAEIRVDFDELASTSSTSAVTDDDAIRAENVLPIPDFQLSVGGQTMTTGTWITMAEAFVAWGALPGPRGGGVLDFPAVRRAGVPFNGLWNAADLLGAEVPDQDWTARIGAVMTHFRRTFRIRRTWMDRFFEIRAYRVATINTETGTRGDATVWSDFSYLPTQRSMRAEQNNGQGLSYAMNVVCYPSSGLLADAPRACPATLTIQDSDQGVFTVSYNPDPNRLYEIALPSQVEEEGANTPPGTLVPSSVAGPSPYLRRSTRGIGWNILGRFQRPATLTASHKLIALLTAIPASPNSKRALCFVDVYPGEVPSFPGQGSCEGPMQEVRVMPSLEVARVAWKDSARDRIIGLFNEDDGKPIGDDAEYALADLVVNYSGDAAGGASLRGIAIAEAARLYHAQRDRAVGSATFHLRGDARLVGSMTGIHHQLNPRGVILSRYDLPGRVEPMNIARFLPASIRRILFRLVNPGK